MSDILIKDHPDLVKDSKSGAVLLKRPKSIVNKDIDNLKKRVSKLEAEVKELQEHNLKIIENMKLQTEMIKGNMNNIATMCGIK